MSEIIFTCSKCGNSVISDDTLCGEIATCPECGKDVVVPIPGLVADMKLGDFRLIKKLGNGSMGEVWLAHQESMERKVALKILAPKLSSDDKFIERFTKEAVNSAKLAHPNIVTAFYSGVEKGIYYLAISYVSGETIDCILEREGIFEEKRALEIILAMAEALDYAWNEARILHRDIKPANIIINSKGIPMLLDMGISKSLNEESELTMTGTVVGTPYYMSPEQALAEKDIDFRTDIYSLGTTLYHMVTGTVPFNATTAMAIIMKHMNEELPHPQERNPKLSDNCATLIEIMMSKERSHRQQSWAALRKDIRLVIDGQPPETPLQGDGLTNSDARASAQTVIASHTEDKTNSEGGGKVEDSSDQASSTEAKSLPQNRPKKKSPLLIVLVLLFVTGLFFIVVAAGIFFYIRSSKPKKKEAAPVYVKLNAKSAKKTESKAKQSSSTEETAKTPAAGVVPKVYDENAKEKPASNSKENKELNW